MNCMNCGALLTESAYCPKCGCDVVVQKQAIVLSGLFYNQGLEKAGIRDLSGAIDQLKRSLKFNKLNVPARNLLGLVYFETGEVVAALSEWVISKNIQPDENIATDYINRLQKDANKLDTINQTIKKYNQALQNCREGNEDVALIQLKKILAQNPKLIKGYHLLALLQIRNEDYEKARKTLKKAARIDKTNTTTLRFLREVDEQTGTVTSLEPRWHTWGSREKKDRTEQTVYQVGNDTIVQPPTFRDTTIGATLVNIGIGLLIGGATVWFLFMPAKTQNINRTANDKVTEYSNTMASQSAQILRLQDEITTSQETVETANTQIDEATKKTDSYENLLKAANELNDGNYSTAATALTNVDSSLLSVDAKATYDSIFSQVQSTMFKKLKETGMDAFDNKDYATAITNLTQAMAIDKEDYEVLNYLAHSYRLSGDAANSDATFQLIIDTFPGTKRATNAQAYLSTNTDGADNGSDESGDSNADDSSDDNADDSSDDNADDSSDSNSDDSGDDNSDEE